MARLDWAVLGAYLVAIVAFGMWVGRGSRRMSDFFLAGRQMRWWTVGLSVMATQISAVTFISTTGQAYADGMRFLVVYFGLPFAMVILCATLVPFFYRAQVFTAYQYLERRFDLRTRTLTSLLFMLSRGLSVGVTLYAPSLVLSVLLGLPERATVLVIAGATILYVLYGGNRSVIWTDTVQMGLIWTGILLCFGLAVHRLPADVSFRDALALAEATGRLRIMDTNPAPTAPYTLWSGLLGGLFLMLSYFGCDQSQVQRYLSSSSLTQSRLSLLFNAVLKVPMQFIILLTGVLVFVFYHFHPAPLLWNPVARARLEAQLPPAELAALQQRLQAAEQGRHQAAEVYLHSRFSAEGPATVERYLQSQRAVEGVRAEAARAAERVGGPQAVESNYVFVNYVLSQLPVGFRGLIIAVIIAAAMTALSGEISALASASMVDLYKRFLEPAPDHPRDLLVSRLLTAFWGGTACLVALQAGHLGSAIEVVNRFGSYFYGSILGVFALAVLTPRARAQGAFYGLMLGMASVAAVAEFTRVHFLWYNVVGAVTVFVTGLAISAAAPPPARD